MGSAWDLLTIDGVDQTRASSEVAFLQTSLDKSNYIVYQSTLCKRILFDDDKNVIGGEVDMGGRQFALMENKEVIVSSGAIQSPHLLMVSGVGPADTLKKHNITVLADRPVLVITCGLVISYDIKNSHVEIAHDSGITYVLGGLSYRVNVITDSALSNSEFATTALEELLANRTGIMTAGANDLLAWKKILQSLRSSFSASTIKAFSEFASE